MNVVSRHIGLGRNKGACFCEDMIMCYIIRIQARFRFIIWRAFKDSMVRDKPTNREGHSLHRSAGACPPRGYDDPNDGEGQALALR